MVEKKASISLIAHYQVNLVHMFEQMQCYMVTKDFVMKIMLDTNSFIIEVSSSIIQLGSLFMKNYLFVIATSAASLFLSSLDSTRSGTAEGRGNSEIDLLFSINSDQERGNVDELLADSDVSLSDQDSSVMDRSSFEVVSEDDGLESSFHESSGGQTEDVIELVFGFVEETKSETSSHEGFTFEESSGVLFVKGQKFSGSLSHLGKNELDSPDFSLVL